MIVAIYHKGKKLSVMVWVTIFGENERSDLIIWRLDPGPGHSASLYCDTPKERPLPFYKDAFEIFLNFFSNCFKITPPSIPRKGANFGFKITVL